MSNTHDDENLKNDVAPVTASDEKANPEGDRVNDRNGDDDPIDNSEQVVSSSTAEGRATPSDWISDDDSGSSQDIDQSALGLKKPSPRVDAERDASLDLLGDFRGSTPATSDDSDSHVHDRNGGDGDGFYGEKDPQALNKKQQLREEVAEALPKHLVASRVGMVHTKPTKGDTGSPDSIQKAKVENQEDKSSRQESKAKNSVNTSCGQDSAWCERIDPRVWDLLLWKNPIVTGAVLGLELVFLLSLEFCSVISVVSYLMLLVLTGAFLTRIVKFVTVAVHKGDNTHPFKDILDYDLTISEDRAKEVAVQIVQQLNCSASYLRDCFFVKDIFTSIKFAVLLYACTYIGAWFNGLTLFTLGVVGAFTLPVVSETNKVQIDWFIAATRDKFNEFYNMLQDKVPFLAKKQKNQ